MTEANPYSPPASQIAETQLSRSVPRRLAGTSIFARCWYGSARLWQAYWLIGIVGQIALLTATSVLAFAWARVLPGAVLWIVLPLNIGYYVYSWVCIWRCAHNSDNPVWGGLARVSVGFSALLMATKALKAVGPLMLGG